MDRPFRILVVDDDPQLLFATLRILKGSGYELIEAASGAEALEKVRELRPDLVLLDVVMPDPDGVAVCRRIKEDPDLAETFVILISSLMTESEHQAGGLEGGADGYIARPVHKRELLARIEALARIRRTQLALKEIALHDPLTGLPNRRLFSDRLDQAVRRARRTGEIVAVLYLDLDGFKAVNDAFGHAAGDCVLRETAHRLQSVLRESDTASRFGGDEFAVVLPDLQHRESAGQVVDKIRFALANPTACAGYEGPIGASIGVAIFPDDGDDGATVLGRADEAMYAVKRERKRGGSGGEG